MKMLLYACDGQLWDCAGVEMAIGLRLRGGEKGKGVERNMGMGMGTGMIAKLWCCCVEGDLRVDRRCFGGVVVRPG